MSEQKLVYNPNKKYTWTPEDTFTLNGGEFGLILNALRAILNTEEAAKVLIANQANTVIEGIMAQAVEAGVQLHKTAFIKRVSRYACEIAVVDSNGNIPFGCEVKINLQMSKDKEFQLQFGTTGAFSPKSSPSSLIRTMHAAQLLEHWDAVCQIMGKHFPYEQTK